MFSNNYNYQQNNKQFNDEIIENKSKTKEQNDQLSYEEFIVFPIQKK